MEETKNKMKCEWKVELVKWYQPHMINFYSVCILSVACLISCNRILQHLSAPFETLIVVLFMAVLIIVDVSMWNNCVIRQRAEELITELKRIQ